MRGLVEQKVRILVVDDHKLVREGFREIINEHPLLKVVGEAENGQQAVNMALYNRPDVIIMDINLPFMNGIEATKHIKKNKPEQIVIAMSMHDDESYRTAMKEAGASAYLTKSCSSTDLYQAILTLTNHASA